MNRFPVSPAPLRRASRAPWRVGTEGPAARNPHEVPGRNLRAPAAFPVSCWSRGVSPKWEGVATPEGGIGRDVVPGQSDG